MLAEKGIRGGMYYMCMQTQVISMWKIMIKKFNNHNSCIKMQTICMDVQCLKNCL